jgi:hypothetical protein
MKPLAEANLLLNVGRDVLFVEAGSLTGASRRRPPIKVENVGHSFGIPINRGLEAAAEQCFGTGLGAAR